MCLRFAPALSVFMGDARRWRSWRSVAKDEAKMGSGQGTMTHYSPHSSGIWNGNVVPIPICSRKENIEGGSNALGIHGEVNRALLMWVELTMQTTGNSYGSQMQRQKYVKQSRSLESQKIGMEFAGIGWRSHGWGN
ncbi:hypothetical protein B0H13DRAFT_1853230 [Mycena leptocephala]|nr:hypothetical protein B0H13DRAFT_1853230 [Mycena leptocephala]